MISTFNFLPKYLIAHFGTLPRREKQNLNTWCSTTTNTKQASTEGCDTDRELQRVSTTKMVAWRTHCALASFDRHTGKYIGPSIVQWHGWHSKGANRVGLPAER